MSMITKEQKKSEATQNNDSVSRYMSEGNPNTDTIIETAQTQPTIDAKLVQETQEAIERESSISEVSRHVGVMAENGVVTLIGTVPTEQEKMTVGDKAAAVAGFGKVNNQLHVSEEGE